MILCRSIILALLLQLADSGYAQRDLDSLRKDISRQWKSDSVGGLGLRAKMIIWDSVKRTYLINGVDINGYKIEKLMELLGEPNRYHTFQYSHGVSFFWGHTHKERRTMIYALNRNAAVFSLDKSQYLELVIRKGKVYVLNYNYIKKFEYHSILKRN